MYTDTAANPPPRIAGQQAYARLRGLILDGVLRPGERLLEERLAADLGISRTPVREALARLRSEGFLAGEGRRGLAVRQYSADDVRDIYDFRAIVEGHAAALAADRATPADIARLHEANERMRQGIERWVRTPTRRERVSEVRLLHEAVVEACHSQRAAMLLRSLVEIPLVLRAASCYSDEQLWRCREEHERVSEAIEARESRRAEMLMAEHIFRSRDLVLIELRRREAESA